jgi:hypothetical protein
LYFFVCNIPEGFKSVDLRAHFSDLIEEEAFLCFHFRHRNELSEDSSGMALGAGHKRHTLFHA